jgi:DNA-3-methyladenine glycosylase II
MPQLITEKTLLEAVQILCEQDADFASIYRQYGPPPLWDRVPGFKTLVHIILEQQVSLASAKAAFDRLNESIKLTPHNLLTLSDAQMLAIGFSRQKTRYVRLLSQSILDGFDLDGLAKLDDLEVRVRLTAHTGIGNWTADIYLLMALGRPDIWPVGDLALQVAYQKIKGLTERPLGPTFEAIGELWKPWRSVAARMLWHYYLKSFAEKRQKT